MVFDYFVGLQVMTVIASPGQGPDRSTEVSYTDTKVKITSHKTNKILEFLDHNPLVTVPLPLIKI